MLVLTHASLAKVNELFRYKRQACQLDPFPGYTHDQWVIKAQNRPWVKEVGKFAKGQKIMEVGGAYSLFPKYLAAKCEVGLWIGDDFGGSSRKSLWSRWGHHRELSNKYPAINYVFEPFGIFCEKYPNHYFDRILTYPHWCIYLINDGWLLLKT